jgi:hypothetical protein
MKIFRDPTEKYSIIFLCVTFALGLTLHLFKEMQPLVIKITELYLFLINSLIFAFGLLNNHRNLTSFTFWSLTTILSIYLFLLLTFNTEIIYGKLVYGETFPTLISGIPIIIPFYWSILILSAYGSFSLLIKNRYLRALIGSFIVIFILLLIEQVADKLDYWKWETTKNQVQYYLIWFILSLFFSEILAVMKIHARSAIFKIFILAQIIFYMTIILA